MSRPDTSTPVEMDPNLSATVVDLAFRADLPALQRLLERIENQPHGARAVAALLYAPEDECGHGALHAAVRSAGTGSGSHRSAALDMVSYLLQRGANPSAMEGTAIGSTRPHVRSRRSLPCA